MPWRNEKRATPKRFRAATPKPTTAHLPLPEAAPKPKNDVPDSQPSPSVPVCESTPWPGAGKMSGNLFEDRTWLLPPNYLDNGNENKTENEPKITTGVASPRLGDQIVLFVGEERGREQGVIAKDVTQAKITKTTGLKTKDSKLEHDKSQAAMGSRNGKVKIPNTTSIDSQIQSWNQNEMRENSIIVNMVMRYSYKN